jgi:hypothetical protein
VARGRPRDLPIEHLFAIIVGPDRDPALVPDEAVR